jgi:uncharacterized protein YxjI
MSTPANWHPDPTGRHQLRYWDGSVWTDHVSDNGVAGVDPVAAGGPASTVSATGTENVVLRVTPDKIQQQVSGTGLRGAGITQPVGQGGGTIFTEPILVVNQKAKLIEVVNQYAVFDQSGNQIASVNEVGQSTAKKALRVLTNFDQFLTHRLEIRDNAGGVLLQLTRPGKVFKSTVIVSDGLGAELGRIVQENVFGKIRFDLQVGGSTVGSIKAENWRAWNFSIEDHTGTEVARITKTWEGLAKTMFTTADNYVVQMHRPLQQPLLAMVVASALSVDTALKQDSR